MTTTNHIAPAWVHMLQAHADQAERRLTSQAPAADPKATNTPSHRKAQP